MRKRSGVRHHGELPRARPGGVGGPQMLRGVGAPGPPALGARAARPVSAAPPASAAPRSSPMSAAGKASGSRSCAQRDVLRRPLADAGQRAQRARSRLSRSAQRREDVRDRRAPPAASARRAPRRAPAACRARRDPPPPAASASGRQRVRPRVAAADRRAASPQAATSLRGQAARRADGDLLAEDRAHRQLEAVPGAGRAQARPRGDQRRQRRILRRGARRSALGSAARSNTRRTRAMIAGSAAHAREADRHAAGRRRRGAWRTIDRRRARRRCATRAARSASPSTRSTPGIARAREEARASPPSRRAAGRRSRTVTPPSAAPAARRRDAAQRAGRAAEQLLEGLVEAAHAAEAGGQRDLGHRQARLVDAAAWRAARGASARPRPARRRGAAGTAGAAAARRRRAARPAPRRRSSSSAPASISASARETVFDVPRQAPRSGAVSGRQRRQGRKPASCAAAAVGIEAACSRASGVRAGQIGRQ